MKLEGTKGGQLEGFRCTVKIDDLCDDGSEPSKFKFDLENANDDSKIIEIAKGCIGTNNNCDIVCKELRKILKEFPYKFYEQS